MILVKFFIHLSDEEQLKRFEARERDPLKSWKLTDEDWRNRKQRKHYVAAIEDMLERTDTDVGAVAPGRGRPEARGARVKVVETVNDALEAGMRAHGIDPPPPRASESAHPTPARCGRRTSTAAIHDPPSG